MFKNIIVNSDAAVVNSYLGLIKWGNTGKVKEEIVSLIQ